MSITNGFLDDASRITSLGAGTTITPRKIVIHYTAGSSLSGAVSALKSQRLSYNVLIDKDGSVHQARGFDRRAGHAGRSNWKEAADVTNSTTLNADGIGISMVNLGLFDFVQGGRYWWSFSNGKVQPPSVADEDANKLASIYGPNRPRHWDPYTPEQVASCRRVVAEIVAAYESIEEIVGHDDIAIDDKFDPGPDFPLQDFRAEFDKHGPLGLRSQVQSPDGELNLRDRPQHRGGRVEQVLHQGDEVFIRSVTYASRSSSAALIRPSRGRALTAWASVDIDGSNRHAGFVSMRYLTKSPLRSDYAARL